MSEAVLMLLSLWGIYLVTGTDPNCRFRSFLELQDMPWVHLLRKRVLQLNAYPRVDILTSKSSIENKTQIDDLVHFTLREWSRLSYNVTGAETERAKAQLKASILLSLDGTTAVAEDIGRQIVTTGRRMNPEEVERVIGGISEKDVMDFARRKLWDKDIAISAVGSIEGEPPYSPVVLITNGPPGQGLLDYQVSRKRPSLRHIEYS